MQMTKAEFEGWYEAARLKARWQKDAMNGDD